MGKNRNTLEFIGTFLDKPTTPEEFIDLSNTSAFLVIKDGKIIYENYSHGDSLDSLHVSFSMAKSFTSALLGIALDEGKLNSLDDPIRKYRPS